MSARTALQWLVERELRQHRARMEEACEAALQGGEHGVLATYDGPWLVSAAVNSTVPYGYIWEEQLREGPAWLPR